MNKIGKIIVSAVAAIAVIGAGLGVHFGYAKTTDELKTYEVETNGAPLRVAVISDLQLPDTRDNTTHQYESFEKTLTMLKEKGMDALIIGGDFTNVGSKNAWGTFKEIYDKVMADSEQPIPLYILGNHDYWLDYFAVSHEIPTPAKMMKRFTEYTGELPYSHKVINGYHFVCWSSSDGSHDKSYTNEKWIRGELDKAVAESPEKPIFVITHINPLETVYGSDGWGNAVAFDEIDYDNHLVYYDENGDKIRFDNDDYEKGTPKKLTEVLYFSDFVLGLNNMSDTAELRFPSTLPENVQYISVTALDSWGAESNTVICEVK